MNRLRVVGVISAAVLVAGVAACTGDPAEPAKPSNAASSTVATTSSASTEPTPSETPSADGESAMFTESTVVSDLQSPYEITLGPDGWLWVTEKTSARVLRIDPAKGTIRRALQVPDMFSFKGQDGLLGMALHPQLLKGNDDQFVYLAYSYDPTRTQKNPAGTKKTNAMKIVRYTYDKPTSKLIDPMVLLDGLPASTDHDGGRLVIGPDLKLYYTIGDQGHLQFSGTCKVNNAQVIPTKAQVAEKNWSAYQGKTLRMNLDGSIPSDNPTINGVRSHVFTYGHRNPQGLVVGPGGKLYSSEQGPKTDDEINLLQSGRNYGWPNVAGYKDDKAYVYANWPAWKDCDPEKFSDYEIPAGVPTTKESAFKDPAFTAPLATFTTVASDTNFQDPTCEANYFVCWPTVAPSSLDYYPSQEIPGWRDSLLMTTLKEGTLYRVPLLEGGKKAGKAVPLFRKVNRYRDTAISADWKTIYVAVDNGGAVKNLDGTPGDTMDNPGAILAFTYKK